VRIVTVHNYYQEAGGEDAVVVAEAQLLEDNGHEVVRLSDDNARIQHMSKLRVAAGTFWSSSGRGLLREEIDKVRPDVVHIHNFFPLISPAAHRLVSARGVPVVQTLHNYRLFCINPNLYRDGRVCEDCLGSRIGWPGIVHRCYRDSLAGSAVNALAFASHRISGTWRVAVDRFIALTDFARNKFVEAGLPAERIVVKPNFVYPDPGPGAGGAGYALYVGRLSPEKGVHTMLDAWREPTAMPLKIVGDGPMADEVRELAARQENVEWLGFLPKPKVIEHLKKADLLVFPSECYEGCPLVLAESLAAGLPVVASRLGSMATMLHHGSTGLLFEPGNAAAMAECVQTLSSDGDRLAAMRAMCRAEFLQTYTPEVNLSQLLAIYDEAMQ
jgi:glycosyltransferase involved in cell wall biosynthesis